MEFDDQEPAEEEDLDLEPSYDDSIRPPPQKSRYKECLKNHAVGIGGYAVDGCGEFIAAGDDGTLESLKCAACNCHRNFHRKESETAAAYGFHFSHFGYRGPPSGYLHVAPRPPLLALPSTSGGGTSREIEMEEYYFSNAGSKKRFRTKFTQEQKEKMLNLAARLGWRIQKQDEEIVQEFCNEMGIKRHVLKVWMHNNKHTLGKKP